MIKNTLLSALLFMCSLTFLQAQSPGSQNSERWSSIARNRFFVGGHFDFNAVTVTKGKYILAGRVAPNIGYFVIKNLAVGYRSDWDVASSGDALDFRNSLYVHYNQPIANKHAAFINVGGGYGYRSNISIVTRERTISTGPILGARVGWAYFMSPSAILELAVNLDQSTLNTDFGPVVSNSTTTKYAFTVGFQILL